LNGLLVGLSEKIKQSATEVVGVAVGIPELIRYRIQEQVATFKRTITIVHVTIKESARPHFALQDMTKTRACKGNF